MGRLRESYECCFLNHELFLLRLHHEPSCGIYSRMTKNGMCGLFSHKHSMVDFCQYLGCILFIMSNIINFV
jgi:hypothetical protein